MKLVADCMAMESKHYSAKQRTIWGYMIRNYKVNGHNYALAWKAAMPLVTTLECNQQSNEILR